MHDFAGPIRAAALAVTLAATATVSGCANASTRTQSAGEGPHPYLPAPRTTLLPTVNVALATGWPAATTPTAAPGLSVSAYATGLDHPRWLYVLPNGDVLVAESNAPASHDASSGVRGWIMKHFMARAGAGVRSADRITLLRGLNERGQATQRTAFVRDLHSPFGMALVGSDFYVADTDELLRFRYTAGDLQITASGTRVMALPAGPINHHWTKDLIASRDGARLYITVGSNSNVGENGMEAEAGRAAIYEYDIASATSRVYATGLRNPNGLAWQPHSGELWVAVNERDELGNDLVPDYMTAVRDGGFYGWPYSYFGQHLDSRPGPAPPGLIARALVPDYALGAHTASLGLRFYDAGLLPAHYFGGAFVAEHGSWNRKPRSGYKVVFIPFAAGRPTTAPEDVLTDFLSTVGEARGRPVGLAVDALGALLVADDVGNTVWRITATQPPAAH